MDVSAWWVVGAFLVGGYAGALLVALMSVASGDDGNAPENFEPVVTVAAARPPGGPGWSL